VQVYISNGYWNFDFVLGDGFWNFWATHFGILQVAYFGKNLKFLFMIMWHWDNFYVNFLFLMGEMNLKIENKRK